MATHTVERNSGVKARRGDLAVYIKTDRDYFIGQESRERTSVTFGIITSVSRAGEVLAASWPHSVANMAPDAVLTKHWSGGAVHTVPAAILDLPALLADCATHTWPGHDNQIMPYEDAADARAVILAHKISK